MTLEEHRQQSELGPFIELFVVDASELGGEVHRFTPIRNGAVKFQGWVWQPIAIEAEGFSAAAEGAAPQPRLRVTNNRGFMTGLLVSYDDLTGAEISRYRTFSKFLDDGEAPDPTQFLGPDVYRVERKSGHSRRAVEFTLASVIDQEQIVIPRRPILQSFCPFRYRRWDADTSSFDYSKATCPYTGSSYFDRDGNVVGSAANDRCSKRLSTGCQKRFSGTLPFGGFPGAGRLPGR